MVRIRIFVTQVRVKIVTQVRVREQNRVKTKLYYKEVLG